MNSNSNQSMDIAEYLSTISCQFKQSRAAYMLDGAADFLAKIKYFWKYEQDIPLIKIRENSFPNAEGMSYVIYINTGIIDYCLGIEPTDIEGVIPDSHYTNGYNYNLICRTAFHWILAHEFFHAVRKHDAGSKSYGMELITNQAQENDADMCALSFIYRWYQIEIASFISSDLILRQCVYYAIFLALRTLPEPKENGQHLPRSERLWHLLVKLISLRRNPDDAPDPDGKSEETKALSPALGKCLLQCEIEFQKTLTNKHAKTNLIELLKEIIDDEKYIAVVERWEEIKHHSS